MSCAQYNLPEADRYLLRDQLCSRKDLLKYHRNSAKMPVKVVTQNCQLLRKFYVDPCLDNEVNTSITCYLFLCPFYEANLWQEPVE